LLYWFKIHAFASIQSLWAHLFLVLSHLPKAANQGIVCPKFGQFRSGIPDFWLKNAYLSGGIVLARVALHSHENIFLKDKDSSRIEGLVV
jgi:hypothetical protein